MCKPDEKLQARGGDMVDDTDAFLAWLDSLPKEPNDKLKAMYAAYKATVKTAPDLMAELEVKLGGALLGQWIDAGMPNEAADEVKAYAWELEQRLPTSEKLAAYRATIEETSSHNKGENHD